MEDFFLRAGLRRSCEAVVCRDGFDCVDWEEDFGLSPLGGLTSEIALSYVTLDRVGDRGTGDDAAMGDTGEENCESRAGRGDI